MNTVWVLKTLLAEELLFDAALVSIFSTKEKALLAFERGIEATNGDLGPMSEFWLHPGALTDELGSDGFCEYHMTYVVLAEIMPDEGDLI